MYLLGGFLRKQDTWIIFLIVIILAACIKLDDPRIIDCSKPDKIIEIKTPYKDQSDDLKSCLDRIDKLNDEIDSWREKYYTVPQCVNLQYDYD